MRIESQAQLPDFAVLLTTQTVFERGEQDDRSRKG